MSYYWIFHFGDTFLISKKPFLYSDRLFSISVFSHLKHIMLSWTVQELQVRPFKKFYFISGVNACVLWWIYFLFVFLVSSLFCYWLFSNIFSPGRSGWANQGPSQGLRKGALFADTELQCISVKCGSTFHFFFLSLLYEEIQRQLKICSTFLHHTNTPN